MQPALMPEIVQLLTHAITEADVAPGASAAVAVRANETWFNFEGAAGNCWPLMLPGRAAPAIEPDTLFDLASITKPLLAFTFARLVTRGELRADTPCARVLPWLAKTQVAEVPLELLLAHRSGLAAHLELFEPIRRGSNFDRRKALFSVANAVRAECELPLASQGEPPVYSDLGYILLGEVIADRTKSPIDSAIVTELTAVGLGGLGSARMWDSDALVRAAATESIDWRGGLLQGQVHDGNAWALANRGSAGHAGFFGSARSVLAFGRLMIDLINGRSNALGNPAVDLLLRRRAGGTLRAGFDSKGGETSSVGSVLGPNTFGHLGFTGTSIWCDPDLECVVVLLTNRVCPSSDNLKIRAARPAVHDALASLPSRGLPHRASGEQSRSS